MSGFSPTSHSPTSWEDGNGEQRGCPEGLNPFWELWGRLACPTALAASPA